MSIVVVGLNHKTAPIDIREKVSFSDESAASLRALKQVDDIEEGTILSTCNRVELCVVSKSPELIPSRLTSFLSSYHGYPSETLAKHLYALRGREAIHHVFRVASSLDSLVVGETQILGQVKESYRRAQEASLLGPVLHRFYHKAFSVAKRVRSETKIGAESVSVGSVAVDLSGDIFDDLSEKIILLMGSGEMMERAARRFCERGVTRFYLTNRTRQNAVRWTNKMREAQFRYIPLEEFPTYLNTVDIILASTSSPSYLVTRPMIERAMHLRKNRPIFCIDISVPRNLDPQIRDLDDVHLYDMDDLEVIAKENSQKRKFHALAAERIISEESDKFYERLSSIRFRPALVRLSS